MNIPSRVTAYVKRHNLAYKEVEHKTVFTAYDLGQTLKTRLEEIAKTLLVKTDSGYMLVVLRASDRLNLGKLKKLLSAKKISIARERDMASQLRVKPGALTAFGNLHKLPTVIEQKLTRVPQALFPSGSFEHSLMIKVKDFLALEKPRRGSFSVPAQLKLQVLPRAAKKKRT